MDNNTNLMMQRLVTSIEKSIEAKFEELGEKIELELNSLKEDFARYEDNYRPTHKNKLDINSYIKKRLGDSYDTHEVEKVQDRVLLMLEAKKWQDVPYDKLTNQRGMAIIDDSIISTIKFRTTNQVSLFDAEEQKSLTED